LRLQREVVHLCYYTKININQKQVL
jgi:hypothetical protein